LKNRLTLLAFIVVFIFPAAYAQKNEMKQFNLQDTVFHAGDFYISDRTPPYFKPCWPGKDDTTYKFLDPFVALMLKNKKIRKIEIGTHTDCRPIPMTNDTLSLRMAVDLKEYFIFKGVDPERLVARGYGGSSPRTVEKDTSVTLDPYKYHSCKDLKMVFKKGTLLTEEFIRSLPSNCEKEAAHQLNRRTVITILEIDSTYN
jgi:hypothetical protein